MKFKGEKVIAATSNNMFLLTEIGSTGLFVFLSNL
jgi:hypothetical protein